MNAVYCILSRVLDSFVSSGPAQRPSVMHLPVVTPHCGWRVEDMIGVILLLDCVKPLIIWAIEGLFPVGLARIRLENYKCYNTGIQFDMDFRDQHQGKETGLTYLTHVTARIWCQSRQSRYPLVGHSPCGSLHIREIRAIRPRSGGFWLDLGGVQDDKCGIYLRCQYDTHSSISPGRGNRVVCFSHNC